MTTIAHIAQDSIIVTTRENAQIAELAGSFVEFAAGDPILNRGAVNTALATAGWEITGRIADIDYATWAVEIDQAGPATRTGVAS